jgi:hypothetical protein
MKTRSPVLGYNHNVRYVGRLWHVQTEDSGVQSPHVFTHLFHDGTILATKRLDYDPTSDPGVVQKLMQAQHKAMLRDLKQGKFDDKIAKFFGTPVVKEREDSSDANPPSGEFFADGPSTDPSIPVVPLESQRITPSGVPRMSPSSQRVMPVARPNPSALGARPATQPGAMRTPAATASSAGNGVPTAPASTPPSRPNLTPSRPSIPVVASRTPPARAPVSGLGARRAGSSAAGIAQPYGGSKPTAEGVVVARPAVIVGDSPEAHARAAGAAPRWGAAAAPPSAAAPAPSENIFGADLISEKSLDEVILAYLSEDLNEK